MSLRLSRTLSLLEKSQEKLNSGQKELLANLDSIMELQDSIDGYDSMQQFLTKAKKTIENRNKNYLETFEETISTYTKDLSELAADDSKSPDDPRQESI